MFAVVFVHFVCPPVTYVHLCSIQSSKTFCKRISTSHGTLCKANMAAISDHHACMLNRHFQYLFYCKMSLF